MLNCFGQGQLYPNTQDDKKGAGSAVGRESHKHFRQVMLGGVCSCFLQEVEGDAWCWIGEEEGGPLFL